MHTDKQEINNSNWRTLYTHTILFPCLMKWIENVDLLCG